jgi:hypothetical protein
MDTLSKENKAIIALSTKYQLFSELANYVLVDEVADNEKPLNLPTMHRVEHMVVESVVPMRRMTAKSMIPPGRRSIAGVGGVLGYDSTVSAMMNEGTVRYLRRGVPEEEKPKSLAKAHNALIQKILNTISKEEYEPYLKLFEKWYLKYNRLPKSKEELIEMGLPGELAKRFDTKAFREQIKVFVIALYQNSDPQEFSEMFLVYVAKIGKKRGLLMKGLEQAKMMMRGIY